MRYSKFWLALRHVLPTESSFDIILRHNGYGLFCYNLLAEYPIAALTVKKALNILLEKGVVNKIGMAYRFQDIFFLRWLEDRI